MAVTGHSWRHWSQVSTQLRLNFPSRAAATHARIAATEHNLLLAATDRNRLTIGLTASVSTTIPAADQATSSAPLSAWMLSRSFPSSLAMPQPMLAERRVE